MKRTWLSFVIPAAICAFSFSMVPASAATFNVKTFGAAGDGVTDDTTAIANAIAAANAHAGNSVVFPQGNYLYSGPLAPISITVYGQHATLTPTNNSAVLSCSGNGVAVKTMNFVSQTGSVAVAINNANGFNVSSNTFSGFPEDLTIQNSSNGQVSSNAFNLPQSAVAISTNQSDTIAITGNNFQGPGSSSLAAYGVMSQNGKNLSISTNSFKCVSIPIAPFKMDTVSCVRNTWQTFTYGIYADTSENFTVSQNVCNSNVPGASGVFFISCKNVNVTQNSVSVLKDEGIGIYLGSVTTATVSNNTVSGGLYGMLLDGVTPATVQRNQVSQCFQGILAEGATLIDSNSISNCQQQGIFSGAFTQSQQITNNSLTDCGLSSVNPPAVIFIDVFGVSISVHNNKYKGNTQNLQYFIDCSPAQPPGSVSGNLTNTFLPNKNGP